MKKTEVTLGIDIGGTNTKFGVVDRQGNCLSEGTMLTKANEDISLFLPRLYSNVEQSLAEIKNSIEIKGVGIGVPNGNFYEGTVEYPANLTGWKAITPLAELVRKNYQLPTALTNDANAAAIGEMKFGAAQNMKNFIVITLGTGLGSGIVVNGELVYGADGFAGELGHVIIEKNGRLGAFGRRGILESYASATGIKRTVYELLADMTEDSELRSISYNDLSANMISEAALRGDKIAIAAFEYTGKILGEQLANTVAHLSPEAIILFGGLTHAGNYLFEPTKRHMELNNVPIFRNKVKIIPSGLLDKNVAVLGASALIWNEIDKVIAK
ncbi:MAG: ROK family protein [Bacteroidetes bacterium]|nr:MAG: ROK family protein [Bacteroidota bacterium]